MFKRTGTDYPKKATVKSLRVKTQACEDNRVIYFGSSFVIAVLDKYIQYLSRFVTPNARLK